MKVRPAFSWVGGKGMLVNRLIKLMPREYRFYLEPYFGAGHLFFSLPPAEVETINDIDEGIIGLYRVLQNPLQFAEFRRLASLTPYSHRLYTESLECWRTESDPVRRAWRWWRS